VRLWNWGSFIFLTSTIKTEIGLYHGDATYGSFLVGVNHVSRTLAMELRKYKIIVNVVTRIPHNSNYFLKIVSDKQQKSVKYTIPL
jgi:NAD(P)-dependent dehydrogenase (short-subunit alcohol dehydrogenase family)